MKMKQRMITIIHPNYKPDYHNRTPPGRNDYVTVPYLATIGVWRIKEILDPEMIRNLARLTNQLERKAKRGVAKVSRAS